MITPSAPLRVLLASALVAGPVALATASAAAPTGTVSAYGDWAVSGGSGTMQIPLDGFPKATVHTDAGSVSTPSGASAFLGADTPMGARYGSSQGKRYINAGSAKGGAPSTTTLTFASPTPAGSWAFALGDVDADKVRVTALGVGGTPLRAAQLGFQGVFNYCVNSPKPSSCTGSGPFTDVPTWDPATSTLTGNVVDTNGASGWFQPTVPVTSLTFTFSVQIGIPIYQVWTASLATSVEGKVSADCGTPVGSTVSLRRADNGKAVTGTDGKPVTATVAADGGYRFDDLAPGSYRAVLNAPKGYTPKTTSTAANTSSGKDVSGADLKLRCAPAPAPPEPPVDAPSGGSVVIDVPPGPGPSENAHPHVVDPPEHGTTEVLSGNKIRYTPEPGFTGQDTFRYTSIDRKGELLRHTVTLTVRPALAATGSDLPPLPFLGLAAGLAATGFTVRRLARRRSGHHSE
ncbi:Ig-like domain-containing protein [Streptacidiphilus cavernicola]|uniref:Ig-like domain-containing protein n=1 Tax=Streptacidiphilus cavernicola TaxID=3342716 RepID=A0ABV6W4Z1_9ACTN